MSGIHGELLGSLVVWATSGQCTLGGSVNRARDLDDFSRDVFGRFNLGGTMNEREM